MNVITAEFREFMYGYFTMPPSDPDEDPKVRFLEHMNMTPDEKRMPVNNRVPRVLMSKQKYALILARDGIGCRYCYEGNEGIEIDHIVPRSAFEADRIDVADRSDNLTVACVPCNQAKSNKNYWYAKRPGVVPACWDCLNPGPDPENEPEAYDEWSEWAAENHRHLVYCGRCGMGAAVPSVSWVL